MTLPARIQFLVEQRPLGIEFAELRQSLGCLEEEMPKGLEKIGSWFAAGTNLKGIAAELVARLRVHHKEHPLEPGLSREALRAGLLAEEVRNFLMLTELCDELMQAGSVQPRCCE